MKRGCPRITSLDSAIIAARTQEGQAVINDLINRVELKAKQFLSTTVESVEEPILIPD